MKKRRFRVLPGYLVLLTCLAAPAAAEVPPAVSRWRH